MPTFDNTTLLDTLIAEAEASIGLAYSEVVLGLRAEFSLAALAELISNGQLDVAFAPIEAHAAKLASAVNRVYIDAGQDTIDELGDALGVVVNFDQVNVRAVRAMAENRVELIRGFSTSQREATRSAILDGIHRGANPMDQARAFRDSVGLTKKQLKYIDNYREELENLSSRALGRKLRDRRFDTRLEDAIDHETPIPKAQIDKMVSRYRERWIKHRSEVIAQNESLQAVHQATDEAVRQAVESGAVDAMNAVSMWNTSADESVRDPSIGDETSHRTMHHQERKFGEPFESGASNLLRFPHDPDAPVYEVAGCRCRVSTRVSL